MYKQSNSGGYFGGVSTDIEFEPSDVSYNRSTPIPAAIGGCPAGTVFTGTITDALDKLFYPYQKPEVRLSSDVATITRQLGIDSIDTLTLTASLTKKTGVLNKVEFYMGGTLLDTQTIDSDVLEYKYEITTPIKESVVFSAKVYDVQNKTATSSVSYNFYYPNFSNFTTKEIEDITIEDIENGAMRLESKASTKEITYTGTMSRYIFCYPKEWGILKSIVDVSAYEYINAFQCVEINYTSGEQIVPMYCYISKEKCNLNNFKYIFKW